MKKLINILLVISTVIIIVLANNNRQLRKDLKVKEDIIYQSSLYSIEMQKKLHYKEKDQVNK